MLFEKLTYNFNIAIEAIAYNKLRALLTSLGIIFGVGSVIAMLAIGSGARQEILDQIRLLGANNIIITPIVQQQEGAVEDEGNVDLTEKQPYSPGLTLADAASIRALVPQVATVNPEIVVETVALRPGFRRTTKLVGVENAFFATSGFELAQGQFFSEEHMRSNASVAIIGQDVKTKFFAKEEAIGNRIKCGQLWLTVIGVLKERNIDAKSIERLGIRNYDLDIYTPITTMLLRFENRAQVTGQEILQAQQEQQQGVAPTSENYHQLDRLVVGVEGSEFVQPVAEVITRMLERRHYGVVDYEVTIPEMLLEQEQRTQNLFNIVLAAIASISLVVGGIGIMNIMLASVMERIKEIGIRRSLGATRQDVHMQFLIEAMALSFSGGVIGILVGLSISFGIEQATGIETIVSLFSVLLAFVVAVTVGLVFGFLPARRAAEHDPVDALRHE
ncbi:MAG: ABC transporter permease [Rhodothermales bacterium]|nr:ABC transporter permease [Rhodothermales bacterium]